MVSKSLYLSPCKKGGARHPDHLGHRARKTERTRSPLLAELIRAHSRRAEPDEVLDETSVAKDSRPADADQDRLDCHDGGNCNAQQRGTACQCGQEDWYSDDSSDSNDDNENNFDHQQCDKSQHDSLRAGRRDG